MAEPQWITQLFEDMILVEGGSFWMGDDESLRKNERPRHKVKVLPFQIAKYPVTQALWEKVMGDNSSDFKADNRPIEQISWDGICQFDGFLDRLNNTPKIAIKNKKDNMLFRLPTEAQWEYAVRGGEEGVADNFMYAGSNNLKEVAWYRNNSNNETKPVGLKLSNQLGLYDMSGNLLEWCADLWHKDYNHAPDNGDEPWLQDGEKDVRVVRGGSWSGNFELCRAAFRDGSNINNRFADIGFRLSRY